MLPAFRPYFVEDARTAPKVSRPDLGIIIWRTTIKDTVDMMCIGAPADVLPCQLVTSIFRPGLFLKQILWKQRNRLFIKTVLRIGLTFVPLKNSSTRLFVIKPTRCTNFTNLFWYMSYRFAVPSWFCSKAVYKPVWHITLVSVQGINSWWLTDELSETCTVSCQNKFVKLMHRVVLLQRNLLRCTVTWT